MKRLSIRGKLLLIVLSFVAPFASVIAYTSTTLRALRTDALVVDVAGRQRALTQRYALLLAEERLERAAMSGNDDRAVRLAAELAGVESLFEASHRALMDGGGTWKDIRLDEPVAIPKVEEAEARRRFEAAYRVWSEMRAMRGRRSPAGEDEVLADLLHGADLLTDKALSELQTAVNLLSDASAHRIERAAWLERALFLLALVLGGGVTLFISRSITRPVEKLERFAVSVDPARPEKTEFLDPDTEDEFGMLMKSFNAMLASLSAATLSRDFVDRIIERVPDVFVVTTPEGRIRLANRGAAVLLGYEHSELPTLPISRIFGKAGLDLFGPDFLALLDSGFFNRHDMPFCRKDGSTFALSCSSAVIRDDTDKVVGIVFIGRDVSEIMDLVKKAQESADAEAKRARELEEMRDAMLFMLNDLDRAHADLKETQEVNIRAAKLASVGALAAGMAHEVKNRLSVIANAAFIIKHQIERLVPSTREPGAPPDRAHLALRHMDTEIHRAAHLINDLLAFARPRPPQASTIELAAALEEVMELVRPEAAQSRVELSVDILPEASRVKADAEQLNQIFLNLLLNAVQAQPKGGSVAVSTRLADSGTSVAIEFLDAGCGMDEERKQKLFTPFFSTKERGTGLGLMVCHGIIERHGGRLEVESSPGRGSRFTVVLPQK